MSERILRAVPPESVYEVWQRNVDELLDLGRSEADADSRMAFYAEAQEIIAEEAPWIFLNVTLEFNGWRDNVSGFTPHPAGHHRLYNVSKAN